MLTKLNIPDQLIIDLLRDHYALEIAAIEFLPLGADVNTAVYRATAGDGTPYFLKLRKGNFDPLAVEVPTFLHDAGAREVMVPLRTADGRLWVEAHGFYWMLYPFVEGKNGYEVPLSEAQWRALGACMRKIHTTPPSDDLAQRLPREDFSPRLRDIVRAYDAALDTITYDDPTNSEFARVWLANRAEIRLVVDRAEQLAGLLQTMPSNFVICHADLHPGNLLIGAYDALAIVDWDNPIMAPKERDLTFYGGGPTGTMNTPTEDALFYFGYGATGINPIALAYYHYERIDADFAAYTTEIPHAASPEDRALSLRYFSGQFAPDEVIAVAHRNWPMR